jgi:hypothetical protein
MVLIKARDGYYGAYAIGTDLTAWDNAQVKLAVAELNAMDWLISANIDHTKVITKNINPMTASHYPKRIDIGRKLGSIATTHFLQTGILTYAVMGACSTVGGGDPYTHTITKATSEAPISFAFHYEKEGSNDSRRKDMVGFVPRALDIYVSERNTIATQTYTGNFACTVAADDLAQPTALTQAAQPPYTWFNYKSSSGASAFTYNTGAINVDIVDVHIHFGWLGSLFGTYDANYYPTNGLVKPPFEAYVDLGVRLTDASDTALDTISDLAHGSYAGDLDYIADFYVGANDYLKYTFDKMYINPESYQEVFPEEGDWFDGVRFRLDFLNENSSLAIEEKNSLSAVYYENT